MSDSTSTPSPISGSRLDEGEELDLSTDLDLEFDGAEDILRSWQVLLPEGAVFYTSDLQALPGVDLGAARPLAPEDAARLFPASLQAGWTFSVLTLPAACGQEVSLISGRAPDS